ncbi:hypothetical protein Gbth_114_006 [Gluconobacter thailandicus F149-1 = NBRC 100600]|uniref:Mor transcription activator domain-containing protein n=2 Tax=Gluconobacter thailandicus TaxID=257438 RepID=A0ABQ0IZF0_GLUTH|nr:hypothetical protein AD946_02605 [Gluconobacter thailandicus]GAC89159.1 hypothetical protein NBRC3255_2820 [Gluconobacter thailandicus NBRC 3255]GAD27575.1 hypothetical protein NBRC3257_2574 [Gluconobacter thailandicus NBRC 3257]GAN94851.1 hypothetical protein Gbth_114_006 [Gluconobacter thailandicus F149-1 = NBRC 100600]GBR60206.1 hypothetical protein AA100600_1824 [Gluconobacter thailandicus F149-1 = NBRC 100600]
MEKEEPMSERKRSLSLDYLETLIPASGLVRFLEQYGGSKIYVPKTLGLAGNRVRTCPLEGLVAWPRKKELREKFGGLDVCVPMGKSFLARQYKKDGLDNKAISRKLGIGVRRVAIMTGPEKTCSGNAAA